MMQGPDGRMVGDCPFSAMGASLCPQDNVAVAIHHVSAYYAFLNVPVGTSFAALMISLLLVACTLLIITIRSPLLGLPILAYVLYDSPPPNAYSRKITRWLSLFENSPSHL
jgi:dolichol kinase